MHKPVDRLVSLPEVRRITSLGTTTIYAAMKREQFPKQIRITPGRVAWRESEIEAWLQNNAENTGTK